MKHRALVLLVLIMLLVAACGGPKAAPTTPPACPEIPAATFQKNADDGIAAGAVIVYERSGGTDCVDDVWSIFPDGRIAGASGSKQASATVTAEEGLCMLKDIETSLLQVVSTSITAPECFTYHITVKSADQVLSVARWTAARIRRQISGRSMPGSRRTFPHFSTGWYYSEGEGKMSQREWFAVSSGSWRLS